jgi:DNA-binding NtrC family response regulator
MARVLVVEPDRQIRNFIAGILADFGHYVRQCGDAEDARQWLRRARFDVLATDLVLGEDAGDILPSARRVPVLTLSGRPGRPAADKYERPPSLHDKPFRCGDLHTLVAAIGTPEPAYPLAA